MRANREYRLIHTRGSRGPSFLAKADSVDHVEIVEVASMEVVLFWDVQGSQARRFLNALRADMARVESDEFLEQWRTIASAADLP